jgi:quinoprotein glucose dehydrogenase
LSRLISVVVSALVLLSGLAFLAGGVWLTALGGSWYYSLVGIALVGTTILMWRRDRSALWLFGITLVVSLIWALWEVGLDWWELAPRGDLLVFLGILLLLPPVTRRLDIRGSPHQALVGLGVAVGLTVVVGGIALLMPSRYEIDGRLSPPVAGGSAGTSDAVPDGDWYAYGRTEYGQRYSPLAQITPDNVSKLQVAWTYHTQDIRSPNDPTETTYEVTPLKVGDTIYFCTPHDLVFALDAETGAEKWEYDPQIKEPPKTSTQHLTCRGVSYDPGPAASTGECAQRLFLPTVDGRLIAISASTGKPCPGFGGDDGTVDLWQNMPNVTPGSYYSTSPPVVTSHLIIVGGAVNDNVSTTETSGVIRAFDLVTGDLVWNWDSLNPDDTAPIGSGTYRANSPNSWSIASYDPELGLIYLPMGNQPPDQFGGRRDANAEKYSAATVALNAETGKVAWVFQGVHHDLWDMDMPAQPSLVDLTINSVVVPALVQPTKQGELFVLNRKTGAPILPVTEDAAPTGAAAGDTSSPTQPRSALSFKPADLTEASMWGLTPFDQLICRIMFRSMTYGGRFTPPSIKGSIIYPGNFGTFNWGGVAVDPERQVVFAMPVYLAFTSRLIPRADDSTRYVTKDGDPPFNENFGAPYAGKLASFLGPLGVPCQAPPWGYVAAADLITGKTVYKHINGTIQDLAPFPLPPLKMGVPGIGGPIITRGGVAFLSGTLDNYVRGYDTTSGKQLWESRLPAGGQATPMTYWSDASQRQFLLVVAGGHGSTGTKAGDSIIAFALPK